MKTMSDPVGIVELARRLGRSERQLRRLATAGKIPRNGDGSFNEEKVRKALDGRTGPYRTKPLKESSGDRTPPIESLADARAAVSLIREVLAEEGRPIKGPPSFDDLRSVESILKSRERALKLAARHGELIDKNWAIRAAFAFTRLQRDALQLLPIRISAILAAELNCDPHALEAALNREIKVHLRATAEIDPEAFAASLPRVKGRTQ